jgi:hypothetical protein
MAKNFDYDLCPWLYNGQKFNEDMIEENYGFVYFILNKINNKKYIGRKYFYTKRKNKKTNRKETKNSDWLFYTGSSQILNKEIEEIGIHNFERHILCLCETKGQTNYNEVKEQFSRNVLYAKLENGDREYYNNNILSRYFVCEKHSQKTIEKIQASSTGRLHSETTKKKMSLIKTGTKASPEAIENMKIAQRKILDKGKNYSHDNETRKKISESKIGKKRNMTEKLKNAVSNNMKKSLSSFQECPYCHTEHNEGNFYKKHGEKCLLSPKFSQIKTDLEFLMSTNIRLNDICNIFSISYNSMYNILKLYEIKIEKNKKINRTYTKETSDLLDTYKNKYKNISIEKRILYDIIDEQSRTTH